MKEALSWLFKACLFGGVVAVAVMCNVSQRDEKLEHYRRMETECKLMKVDTTRWVTSKEWLCPNGVTYSLKY